MARYEDPTPQYLDGAGNPLVNGQLFFFKSDTDTQIITYKDKLQLIPNSHPVLLDAAARVPNVFFSESAKVVLIADDLFTGEVGKQIFEKDPVGGEQELGDFAPWNTAVTYDKGDFAEGSDGDFYQSLSNGNIGNDPTLNPSLWEKKPFNGMYNANISYSIGDVTQTADGKLWRSIITSNIGNDPSVDAGTNWRISVDELWVNKSSAFNVVASKRYSIDGSVSSVDAALSSAYSVGDVIIVHNESISTNLVRLTNTSLTIKGPGDTVTTSDNLVLSAGDTAMLVAKTTTILELV